MNEEEKRRLAERDELYDANRRATVGELAAAMAHELGTPLAVVQARAQMIAAGEVAPSELRGEAEVILEQTRRITQMVRDLLELARPRAPTTLPVDLAGLARHAVALLVPVARERNAKIVLVGEPPRIMVRGEASKLLQILTNLAMNAIHAMPRGGLVRLAVTRRRARPPDNSPEADYHCVDVSDDGEGISDLNRPRVFESFFTTHRAGEGTGLGLPVSYRLARDHDGWIGVESTVGVGSCFTLYLPPLTDERPR